MPSFKYGIHGYSVEEMVMFQDAEWAIDKADAWEWVRTTPVRADYSFCADPKWQDINMNMRYLEHTNETIVFTMKKMKEVANEGTEMVAQMMTPVANEKEVLMRTPEMDAKVLDVYSKLAAFKSPPKWAREYVRLYPQLLATRK